MLTREQIEEIQKECRERCISVKNLLKEKDIPDSQYFWWKRKYSKQEVQEGFLPVAGGQSQSSLLGQKRHQEQSPSLMSPVRTG